MEITVLHHIALTVTDIERSRKFYREVLSLEEIPRPTFTFPVAWFQFGDSRQVHLIVHSCATFREKPLATRDVHFAVRVANYRAAVEFLRSKGYREDADPNDPYYMKVQPHPTAGYPQIYICDPDRHVIEINSERLDEERVPTGK
ncbi:MAG TPA: VOC family protein [Bryobacteraceae bacterium]|nr:VOC family protein [Bryobacteraceae bacterium]